MALALAVALSACGGDDDAGPAARATAGGPAFSEPRDIDNPFLPLTKFSRCELRGQEDGERLRVIRRLLGESEPFELGGETIEVAVVEDSEYVSGELVERTRDYFAQADDGTVHYFGEDVNDYENGKLVGHGGAWRFGEDTDELGTVMAGDPDVGTRWQAEDVPGVTREDIRVVERLESARVRGHEYRDVIRVRESIEPEGDVEFKLYARGMGLIRELPPNGRVELVRCA